jgi:hypothetical protein
VDERAFIVPSIVQGAEFQQPHFVGVEREPKLREPLAQPG